MRVTTVRYGQLRSLPDYENVRIELEATVEPGDNASDVLHALRTEVLVTLGLVAHEHKLVDQVKHLQDTIETLAQHRHAVEQECLDLQAQIREQYAFIEAAKAYGVPVPKILEPDEIPF